MQKNKDKNDRFQLRPENSSIFVKCERKKKPANLEFSMQ